MPNYARRTRIAAAFLIVLPTLCCLGVLMFLFTRCSFNKPFVAAGLPEPDHAFQTGTVFGYNVYVWDCYQNKHIVVYNSTGEMYSGPFAREEVACGERAPIEIKLADAEPRRELNPDNFW